MTLVSVLVAAYKPTYLEVALGSALGQTHRDLEVVVIDDSTGREVAEIVRECGDARIRYVRNETNQGPALSHARAIAEASGSVLGVLNDDDVWEPDFVARLLDALQTAPEAVVAFADHWIMVNGMKDPVASDECSRAWSRDHLAPGLHLPFKRLAVLDKPVSIAGAALFRSAAVAGIVIPKEVGGTYDYFLAYVLCRDGAGAVYVPQRLASWRTHDGNLTNEASCARAEEGAAVMRIVFADQRLAQFRPALRAAYRSALWCVATRNLRGGSRRRTATAALAATRHGHVKSALLLPAILLPRWVIRSCW